MTKPLSGKVCVVTGLFTRLTQHQAQELLVDLGASIRSSVSRKTDLLVAGEGSGKKLHQAHKEGVPVLNEEQLQELLDGKPLDEVLSEIVAAKTPEPVLLEETFGHFRGVLIQGPTRAAWDQLIGLLDATPNEQLPMIVDYLLPHLSTWDGLEHERWEEKDFSNERFPHFWKHRIERSWVHSIDPREIRIAPVHWVNEMVQGLNSPKWRLVRHLHLRHMSLSGKQAIQLLNCPDLCHVEILTLVGNPKLSPTFFKKLRLSKTMKNLTTLRLGKISTKQMEKLRGEAVFQLEGLGFSDDGFVVKEAFDELFAAECVSKISLLDILSAELEDWTQSMLENSTSLANVTHLRYEVSHLEEESLQDFLKIGLTQQLTSFGFGYFHMNDGGVTKWLHPANVPKLERLDVRSVIRRKDLWASNDVQATRSQFKEFLEDSGLLPQLKTILLGFLTTPELEDLLNHHNIEIL